MKIGRVYKLFIWLWRCILWSFVGLNSLKGKIYFWENEGRPFRKYFTISETRTFSLPFIEMNNSDICDSPHYVFMEWSSHAGWSRRGFYWAWQKRHAHRELARNPEI